MSVRKREWRTSRGEAKSAWVVDYIDQGGKRRLKTFKLKKAADVFAATATVEIRAFLHTADSASITVAAAATDWIRAGQNAGLEGSTIDQREQHVRLHIVPFMGMLKLSQLSVPRIRAFESELRESGRSEAMVRRIVTSLSGILTDAQERGTVARNPVRELKGQRHGRDKKGIDRRRGRLRAGVDIPLPGEVKAIVGALAGQYRDLLLTALFSGLRASELRGLDWANVDLQAGVIHVRERADKRNLIGPPKSRAGERQVPLTPMVVNALKARHLASGGRGLVFGTRGGRPDYITNIVKCGWIPTQVAAGVTGQVLDHSGRVSLSDEGTPVLTAKYTGLHSARHFYASWCINPPEAGGLGLTAKAVQERLGHSTIAMTLDTYGHLFPRGDDGEKLAAAEAALFAG